MEWLQRISFLLSMIGLIRADVKTYCTALNPKQSGIVRPTIPSQFSVHAEMIDVVTSSVTEITEYHDGPGRRAAVFISENAGKSKQYYRYDQQLFLEIYEDIGSCTSESISAGDQMTGFKQKNGTNKILSVSDALHFNAPGQVENYIGPAVIRGINTDHWSSCVNMQDPKANLAIDWYFSSADKWNTDSQSEQVPVRVYIRGIAYKSPTITHKIEQYFELYHYRTGLPKDQTVFDIPRGVICKMGQHPKMPPKIPKIMSFRLEHIDTQNEIVTYSDEVYNFISYVTKHVYRSSEFFKYSRNPLTVINDFNTGVSYDIDKTFGNCTIRPISQLPTDVKMVDSRHVRMTNPQEFFQLENHFYQGVRTTRDIECNVWIGSGLDKSNKTDRTEWFFAIPNVVGQEVTTEDTLVHYAEYRKNELLPAFLTNLYDFTQDAPDILQFDISQCYTYTKRENFELYFDKKYAGHIATAMKKFKNLFIMSVASALSISPLRVQNVDVSQMLDGGMSVSFEILDAAPTIGDVEFPVKEKSLATAASELHQKLKSKTLEIFLQSYDGVISVIPIEFTIDLKQSSMTRYNGGSMFALAFMMTLIGMVLAAIITYKIKL